MSTIVIELPDDIEKSHRFQLTTCRDPSCGVHIVAFDEHDVAIVEIVVGTAQLPSVISALQAILAHKTRKPS